ncbi:uncharacterized protein LOC131226949 [Magnolia sinica]|uniref:uncharacterized protein LOC131226949 n=1 Tax=Magnolia sinica TaxID=86752 RepID=UPI00265A5D60|nr:uncharacterized protein LOC131226949 [Magnolia sinica]
MSKFQGCNIGQIPRTENSWANALVKLTSAIEGNILKIVPIEFLNEPSINHPNKGIVHPMQTTTSWMDPIIGYLKDGKIPKDKLEARRLRLRATRYAIIGDTLYKKGYFLPYMRCLRPDEAEYMIQETHEWICGNHSGGQALAQKIICQGYLWPTIREDSRGFTWKCDKCQRFDIILRQPAEELTPMSRPWPFS